MPVAQYDKLGTEGKEDVDEELVENGGRYTKKMAVGQVTIRLPLNPNPLNIIAILYGFLPWLVPLSMVIYFLITWHFIVLYGLCINIFASILNEAILKPILKQPRPKQTANRKPDGSIKPGMPSGHVFNASAIMVWALMEVYFQGPGLEEHAKLSYYWIGAIALLMGPVPWARWYNYDHTAMQCLVGGILGTATGIGAFYLRVHFFPGPWKPWLDVIGEEAKHAGKYLGWTPPWVASDAAPAAAEEAKKKVSKILLL